MGVISAALRFGGINLLNEKMVGRELCRTAGCCNVYCIDGLSGDKFIEREKE